MPGTAEAAAEASIGDSSPSRHGAAVTLTTAKSSLISKENINNHDDDDVKLACDVRGCASFVAPAPPPKVVQFWQLAVLLHQSVLLMQLRL